MIRIAYVGLAYNYGKAEEGASYEANNIEAGFREWSENRDDVEVTCYHPDRESGNKMPVKAPLMWDLMRERIDDEKLDAIFHVAFNETLDLPEDIAKMALERDIPVIQWDCDSSWRFENWVLPRKHRVSHFVTTHSNTVPWYKQHGMKVIRSQWGGSPLYVPAPDSEKIYDVSFVGQKHGQLPNGKFWRQEIVEAIRNAGIDIHLFGNYWDGQPNWHGYLTDFNDMLEVFQRSKICLNLSNPWHIETLPQIKGRHFEIPQVGSLQVSTPADDLERYFVPDKEIVLASTPSQLITKLRYYLSNDKDREKVAAAGHERMIQEHQWHHRLDAVFKEVGIL